MISHIRCVPLLSFLSVVTISEPTRAATNTELAPLNATVLMGGRVAGEQRGWKSGDREWTYTFRYNDRGRGDSLVTRIEFDPNGDPRSIRTDGHDYYKAPVRERFDRNGDVASWENTSERGSKHVTGPGYYVSINSADDAGVLVRALLAAKAQTLPILPEGQARVTRVSSFRVGLGKDSMTVVHYDVFGLGLTPQAVWLDEGAQFFFSGSDYFSVVRRGWEGTVPALIAEQDRADQKRARENANKLIERPGKPLVFRDVALFDAVHARVVPHATITVEGDRIRAIGNKGVPAVATVIEGRGRMLMPGLWDMHVHIGADDGPLHLAAGVTSVRDCGNDTVRVFALRDAWGKGESIGPRVFPSGFLDGPGTYTAPVGVKVSTEDEGVAMVRHFAAMGFERIKLYSSLDPKLVAPLAAEAHRLGLGVHGHIPRGMNAEQAVRNGYDEITHANFLVLNFLSDTIDTRTMERFLAVGREAGSLDLSSERVRAFVRLLHERGTVVDPTLGVFESNFLGRPGSMLPSDSLIAGRLPPTVRRGLLGGGLPVPEGMDGRYRSAFATLSRMVGMLYRDSVTIVAGTDGFPGFALDRELELYVAAGIPAPEVLRIATLGAARVAHHDRDLGSIEVGKLADLILVDGDPTRRISDIRKVDLVVKNGWIYQPDDLCGIVGIQPRSAVP